MEQLASNILPYSGVEMQFFQESAPQLVPGGPFLSPWSQPRQLFVLATLLALLQLTPCAPSLSQASFRSFTALSLPVTCDYFFPLLQNAVFFPEEISRHGDKNRKKGNNFLLAPRLGLETSLTSTVHPATKPTCKRSSSRRTEWGTGTSTRQNSPVLPLTSPELH